MGSPVPYVMIKFWGDASACRAPPSWLVEAGSEPQTTKAAWVSLGGLESV